MVSSESLTESTTVVADESCLSTTIENEAVILHADAGKYYGFNQVGTYIWELLQEPFTLEEITENVTTEYDVTRNQCREDVYELISELLEYNLIRIVDE